MTSPNNENPVITPDDIADKEGVIPSIKDKIDNAVLNEPSVTLKAKNNVNKAAIYMLLGVFGIAVAYLMLTFTQKKSKAEEAEKAKEKPAFAIDNKEVDNKSILDKKLAILKAEAELKKREEARLAEEKRAADALAQAENAKKQIESQQVEAALGNSSQVGTKNGKPEVKPETPFDRKMKGEVLFEVGGIKNTVTDDESLADSTESAGHNNGIADSLKPTVLASRNAGRLPSLDYLLKRGTTIPCSLKTGIDTTLAGFVICTVTNDVYSANGNVLLVERGATVFGEQQSSLKRGQTRTFVLWTRIDNPSGVFAYLDSPATDRMGYNGIDGFVDRHFWERFSGAIMISVIKDLSQVMVNKNSPNNNGGVTFDNSSRASETMAVETLRSTINIPPTLRVNPATVVNVMVARDVSFKNVYTVSE